MRVLRCNRLIFTVHKQNRRNYVVIRLVRYSELDWAYYRIFQFGRKYTNFSSYSIKNIPSSFAGDERAGRGGGSDVGRIQILVVLGDVDVHYFALRQLLLR